MSSISDGVSTDQRKLSLILAPAAGTDALGGRAHAPVIRLSPEREGAGSWTWEKGEASGKCRGDDSISTDTLPASSSSHPLISGFTSVSFPLLTEKSELNLLINTEVIKKPLLIKGEQKDV